MIIPDEYKDDYEVLHQDLMEKVADTSEELTAKFMEHGELSDSDIIQAIFMLTRHDKHKVVLSDFGGFQVFPGDTVPRTCPTCKHFTGKACAAPAPSWAMRPLIRIEVSGDVAFHAANGAWKPIVDCPAYVGKESN